MEFGEAHIRPGQGLGWVDLAMGAKVSEHQQQIGHADYAISIEVTAAGVVDRWPRHGDRGKKQGEGEKEGAKHGNQRLHSLPKQGQGCP